MKPCGVFDVGGTKTLLAFVDERGVVLERVAYPTPRVGCEEVLADCCARMRAMLEQRSWRWDDLCGLGVNMPGTVDERGTLLYAPFTGWRRQPVAEMLARLAPGVPARVDNDVNACALGELRFGMGRRCRDMLWMTVSTGIGGAVVSDGRLLRGGHQLAGEIGHVRVEWQEPAPCGCGLSGCLEAHASGTAVTREARALCARDPALRRLFGDRPIDAKQAARLAREGSAELARVFERAGMYLGRGLAAAVSLIDPQWIVLGGGMAESLPLYRDAMLATLRESLPTNTPLPRVAATPLGYDAAAIGAAAGFWLEREAAGASSENGKA